MKSIKCAFQWSAILALALAGPGRFKAIADEGMPRMRPNVVFILVDDMGWADGGCLGSTFYKTPNLDRLAASGMRFTQAYASCAVCSPTRAALLTGKTPARLHITDWIGGETPPKNSRFTLPDWRKYLPLEEVTLAEAFKRQGYNTAHIGKWHLGGNGCLPQFQGFDTNIAGGEIGHPVSYFWPYGKEGQSHRVPGLSDRGGHPGDYLTDQLTGESLRFIEANRDHLFYLQLWHYAVHDPLMGKNEYVEAFSRTPGSNGQSNSVYAAMLKSVDDSVGRIVAKLDELGISDRTIVVFSSDNGGAVHFGKPPATSNAPLRMGKGYAYEGGLRVPFIIKAPWMIKSGAVSSTPIISHDLFPTLLELSEAPPTAWASATDGVSFARFLRGGNPPARDALFWHYPHYWNGGKISPYSVVRAGNWKLIRFYESDREELYNLAADPGETKDLAASEPAKRQELGARLDAWLKESGAQMPPPRGATPR